MGKNRRSYSDSLYMSNICYDYGKGFIADFHTIFCEGVHGDHFECCCIRMQKSLDFCRKLRGPKKKYPLTNEELVDSFFTAWGSIGPLQGFYSNREKYSYILICIKLLRSKSGLTVKQAAEVVLSKKIIKKPKTRYIW